MTFNLYAPKAVKVEVTGDFLPTQTIEVEGYGKYDAREFYLNLHSNAVSYGEEFWQMMSKMFLNRSMPFYQFGDLMWLQKIPTSIFCILLNSLMMMAQPNLSVLSVTGKTGDEVSCGLQDAEGYWWYGGKGTGLCRFDGYETEMFRSDRQHPDLLRSNDVLCMVELEESAEIWFGTKEGAYILSKKDYSVCPIVLKSAQEDNELADKRISCMLSAADGSVWLTYRNQLLHFSTKAELIERFETTWEGKNRSVLRLCFDADSALWAGLWNGGVIRWKKVNGRWQKENRSWDDYPAVPQTPLTTKQQEQMLDSVMSKQTLGNDTTILSWAAQSDGSVYIGTYHSLYFYNGQQVSQLQTGLDKVRSMAYSEKNLTLYLLSKARGVCQWKDEQLTVLLDSNDFRQLHLQGDTALLLLKGVTDVRMLNLKTRQLAVDTTMADVTPIVTAYILDGEKRLMPYGEKRLVLPKGTELVEISLSSLDFDHASQVQFAYRLNDDSEWAELPDGEHVIKFAHLPSGESRLQVRATDSYGRWSARTAVLSLVRSARWYEYTWLWMLLAIVVVMGVIGLIKFMRPKRPIEVESLLQPSPPSQEAAEEASNKLPVANQEFLDKAVAAVSAHIIDSDYSVDALASDLCMSRANLHRKMRAITGQTPTEFIRNQRLERAAHLLRTTSHSVNEISDLVGFSYASYFTKCFKEKYGVLPKDYVK